MFGFPLKGRGAGFGGFPARSRFAGFGGWPGPVFNNQGWNVSTAVYLQEFDLSPKDTSPQDVFFKFDGLKMYILGDDGNSVDEYNLKIAWDISTAVYLQEFDVSPKEIYPQGLFFKPDGTKMYNLGYSSVDEYDLKIAWDISTAVHLQEFDVSSEDSESRGLFFKPDGTKMYIAGNANDSIYEYNLSIPWNVSTAVYLQALDVSSEDAFPRGLFFKPDGTKMYLVGSLNDFVYEYNLSIPWNVSTAVYLQKFYVRPKTQNAPSGPFFKPDGTKMYILSYTNNSIYEYNLTH